MVKFFFIVCCLPGLLFITSCQKQLSFPVVTTPVTPTATKKIAALYMSDGASQEAVFKYYFKYDAGNRISSINYYTVIAPGDSTLYITTGFVYNGAAKTPQKIIKRLTDDASDVVATSFLFYDQNGKVVRDSVYEIYTDLVHLNPQFSTTDTSVTIVRLDYTTNKVRRRSQTKNRFSTFALFNDSITLVNNNFGFIHITSDAYPADLVYNKVELTYDNKPNPLQFFDVYVPVEQLWHVPPTVYLLGELEFNSRNNSTLQRETEYTYSFPSYEFRVNLSYEYGTNDRPLKATINRAGFLRPTPQYWYYIYQ